jgi:signal transduction histidine kinase
MDNILHNSILVVDDVLINIKVLLEILTEAGYKVAVAKNGKSALEKIEEVMPSLILLDVMMPVMDGFETCRILKSNPKTKDIPIIFMTALSESINKVKGLKLGAVDYITKPFEHEEVLARIHVHLELRRTQLKLAQEEKMSSLGQLVAGIAHEINNPVNFISGNIIHAERYIKDLLQLLELYEKHTKNPIPEIDVFSNKIELDFLKQDLLQILSSMKNGSERVEQIVRSLRLFSRLDNMEWQLFDLHEAIDSTLVILSSRIKATSTRPNINIIKEYGELPLVECYAGKINQVLMNLLANAIDALDEAIEKQETNSEQSPTIWIKTAVTSDEQSVLIEIADNGIGMSEEVRQRMFEQFFTTKPLGKGTGLGMAIAWEIIVEKHGGTLDVDSSPGKGAKFAIAIPIRQGRD